LVSETTDKERASAEGVKPDLVQGVEFAYTLPAADLVVLFQFAALSSSLMPPDLRFKLV